MPDWFKEAIGGAGGEAPTLDTICSRLVLSWVAGFFVAGVYTVGLGRRKDESATLPTTLVLLTIVIAMVTLVIGNSVARAFGLVGALSIVRFRTVVEDTRDTAFVIFAVAVGMAIGAGYGLLGFVGMPAILFAALIMRYGVHDTAARGTRGTLSVKIGLGLDPETLLGTILSQHLTEQRLVGSSTAKQGAAIELNYQVRMRPSGSAFALVADLNRIEGVQGVELRGS
ncbi:MAG: DUF4956 domain-containing protein [Gemmataceae bacterium]|nr:DUF4956 domain-containing protein [Gemmataceae bacterium]